MSSLHREKIVQGINDIFTLVPKLKQEWDFEKNIKISPYNLSINSGRKVWWKCKKVILGKPLFKQDDLQNVRIVQTDLQVEKII